MFMSTEIPVLSAYTLKIWWKFNVQQQYIGWVNFISNTHTHTHIPFEHANFFVGPSTSEKHNTMNVGDY